VPCQRNSELQLEVTHLVTNGCSFTFGDELENPRTQAWPALLAKRLGLPIVNLALPGTGNDCILRRTTEYLYKNSSTGSKPLVIIAWSQDWRREEWFTDYYEYKGHNNYGIVQLPDDLPRHDYERVMLDNWSDEDIYRKTLLRKLNMKHLLSTFNIPYISTAFAYSDYDHDKLDQIKKRFSYMVKPLMDDPWKIEDMFNVVPDSYPKMPQGHYGYEAQEFTSEYIHNAISRIHGNIVPIKSDYLTLADYVAEDNYTWGKWLHWANLD
jgi:hypothetical protein